MKSKFQSWYEAVQLTLDPQVMDARWAAVGELAKSVNDKELEALVRAAFRSDQTTTEIGIVRTKLAENGAAIQDEEFALLAAATLFVILEQSEPVSARAATMIGTAHFKGLRSVVQPMDLIGLGSGARIVLARTTRSRPPLQLAPMPSLAVETTQAVEADEVNESIKLLAAAFTEVVQQLTARQTDFEQRTLKYISIQDEELDMLWWLQGGRTQSGQLFAELPRDQRPFVLARDLAEITFAMPGASAIESLFDRAGVEDSEPQEITAAIQALPIDWLKTALPDADKGKVSPVTTPLHEGIKRRLETRGEDAWIAGWAGVCDVEKTSRLTPLQLADLFYCEQLLLRK